MVLLVIGSYLPVEAELSCMRSRGLTISTHDICASRHLSIFYWIQTLSLMSVMEQAYKKNASQVILKSLLVQLIMKTT